MDVAAYRQDMGCSQQQGILCGWPGHLELSPNAHSFGTDIINVEKHAQDTSFLTFLLFCFAEYRQRTLYGALVVALAMLLRLINYRFIIIIIIIINVFSEKCPR